MTKITVYVPVFVADSQGYPTKAAAFNVLGFFRERLWQNGVTGMTVHPESYGYWESFKGDTILDSVIPVVIVANIEHVMPALEWLKDYTNQQDLFVTKEEVSLVNV